MVTQLPYLTAMFTVLHSSAGAGKTHTLVKHYLGHALNGTDPGAYRQVLALTFTNKAAGEMKERVVQYLERMAAGEQGHAQIDDVVDHLARSAHCTPDEVGRRAASTLTHMLHHWGDVAIGTIDSFTRRVVRPFARDLQLDHELRMTTEEDHYRGLAVEALIQDAGVEPTVTGLLTDACLQLLHEERRWDPEKPLLELGRELAKEGSILPLEQLASLDPGRVKELVHELRADEAVFRQQVNSLGREALQLVRDAGVAPEDLAYGRGGIWSHFNKLANFTHEWPPPGRNSLAPVETGKWHGSKASEKVRGALQGLADPLTRIFHAAAELRDAGYRTFLVRRAIASELITAFTLHELDQRLQRIKQDDGVAFFSDLTRKVAQVVKHEPVPFIHERMGERYRHYLIDEFQDTSMLQWNSLLPLIDNALGSGGSALLVGDAKQAIYRWRNGEVRLFTSFPRIFGRGDEPVDRIREKTLIDHFQQGAALDRNYRSGRDIVAFNNDLFGPLPSLLPEDLRAVYAGHTQDAASDRHGYVLLQRLARENTGEQRTEAALTFMLDALREVIADGFVPGDVAVLVRSGKLGKAVARHLIDHGFPVVSADGLQLAGDPVIELVIDLLRFLHGGDVTAATRVLQYQAMLRAPDGDRPVDPFADHAGLPSPASDLRHWLENHGAPSLRTTLTALVCELARAHGLRPAEDAQLLTLLDEVHAWTNLHGQDLGGFLQHWERSGGRRSVTPPEHGQAVQVMTIHRSKGLQFPVVIVPDANMSGGGNHVERIWIDPGPIVPELPVALIKESKALREAGLPELDEETGLELLDTMNLLYVAFTRPEQRLYALVPEAKADDVTSAVLEHMAREGNGDRLERGERTGPWKDRKGLQPRFLRDVAGGTADPGPVLRYEAPASWDPADPDPHRRIGNALHEVLARTVQAEDLDASLQRAVLDGSLPAEEVHDIRRDLSAILGSPALAPYFGGHLKVRTEATLIAADGKAFRPDRVVLDGEVVRVLDIKTGKPSDAHHAQVRGYMRLLVELGHERVEGALLYLPKGELVNVVA